MPSGKKHPVASATKRGKTGDRFGTTTRPSESRYAAGPKKTHRKGVRPPAEAAAGPGHDSRRASYSADGASDPADRRPRHAQVARDARRTEASTGSRHASSERRVESTDRPARRSEPASERAGRHQAADRPVRHYDNSDRPAGRYTSSSRPTRTYGADRPVRTYDEDTSDRGYRSERPARSYGNDRPTRSFDSDRPARTYGSDRPARTYGSDRPARSFGNDRPARSFDSDRPARTYGSDRPATSFDSDRPARSHGSERPARTYGSDRPARSYDSERPARSYGEDRKQEQIRSYQSSEPRIAESDRVPMRSVTAAARPSATKVEVTDDNGFTALGLPHALVEALAAGGIAEPFAVQGEAIPDGLAGHDVLARAQTGSGKTLAFGLPMISKLAGQKREARRPHGLVLVPTRELAMQVLDALAPLGKSMGLKMVLIAGGMAYNKQLDALKMGVDVLVATPGRLIDLMDRGAADLSAVQISVLDEADQMCDMGFAPEVSRILDETPANGQRLLFSATLDGDVDKLVKRYLHNPINHSTADSQVPVTAMEHHVFVVHPGRKSEVTAELASGEGRTIVFVRTKLGADRVAEKLRDAGVGAAALHGGLNQSARTRTLAAFKDGHVPVLVATDVAARGIHIDDVQLVLQADPPADHKTYLHRAGRTARAGGSGSVVTLAMPRERNGVERTTRSAGVTDLRSVYVEPGDAPIQGITGGAQPSGIPVAEYRPPAPERSYRGRPRTGSSNFNRRPRRP